MKRAKILEIDVLRAVAIFAVVLIHGTSQATVEPTEGSLSQILFYIMNLASGFAVPMFILISGLVLFYRYYPEWSWHSVLQFYKKRIWSVAVPYLLWSFFYYVYNQKLFFGTVEVDWGQFFTLIKWADTSYHLYFMIIILQFYLFFPMQMMMLKRWPKLVAWLLPVSFVIHGAFYAYKYWFATVPHGPSLMLTYFFFFNMGAFIGIHYEKVTAWLSRYYGWFIGTAAAGGVSYVGLFLFSRYLHKYADNTWYVVTNLIYVIALSFALLWLGRILVKHVGHPLMKVMLSLGKYSFGIYLVHPAILSVIRFKLQAPGTIAGYVVYIAWTFGAVLGASWLVSYLYSAGMKAFGAWRKKDRRPDIKGTPMGA